MKILSIQIFLIKLVEYTNRILKICETEVFQFETATLGIL